MAKTEAAMKHMNEQLKYWITMRDDSGKAADVINNTKRSHEARQTELETESERVFSTFRDASRRSQEARRKYVDATTAFERARAAPASSSYTSDYRSAFERWSRADDEQREAEKALYETVVQMQKFCGEVQNRLTDLGRTLQELDRFQASLNPEALGRRITEFTEWLQLLQNDIDR